MKEYSREMKLMMIEAHQQGASVASLSKLYGISRYAIQSWCGLRKEVELRHAAPLPKGRPRKRKTTQATGKSGTNDQTIKNGKRAVAKFSVSRWKEVKPRLKYQIIFVLRKRYGIKEMCDFFEVSRSGYYSYLYRKDRLDKDMPIAELIRECQSQRGKIHGYRYIHLWLMRKKQLYINPKTVLRMMRKYGLLSEVRRRKYHPCGEQLHRYANLLKRNFNAEHPNSKWVTDISYIPTQQGFLYLSVIRDLFDNSIVAYKTSHHQTVTLVLETLRAAMEKETVAGELQLHSDQGSQYTSQAYFNLTQEYGITPSMSRRGNPYDNAMAENFFSILKTECIYRQKIQTFQQACELIDDFIHFYNFERFQLKYRLTPFEKRGQSA